MLDDRLGFATHFDQGWSLELIPFIASSGAGWIRDDLSWAAMEESPGVYAVPPSKQAWIDALNAAGLKVCLCLNYPPTFHADYDPAAASLFCAWFAATQGSKVAAIEVTNEPNNAYATAVGSGWQTKLVYLTNMIYEAVQAVSPTTQVIGLGAQGQQILDMLCMGVQADGIVCHPYSDAWIAERTYEPPYKEYELWIQALTEATQLPRWETEWGWVDTAYGEYYQATNICRRLLESLGLGVSHTFIYDFINAGGDDFGVLCSNVNPKQSYFAVKNTILPLAGVVASGQQVGISTSFSVPALRAYTFQGLNKTVLAAWIGDAMPNYWSAPTFVKLTFPVPHGHSSSTVIDPVMGITTKVTSYPWSQVAGKTFTISLPVSSKPILVIIQ